MHDSPNRYCARLHIPVPDLDVVAGQPETSLFHLIVAALLERGAPMTFDEIVARVERVALPPRLARDDLRAGLNKAWHGRPPVVHDTGGRLALDLLFGDWWYVLARMEPQRQRPRPSPPAFTQPPDDVPLSAEEVDERSFHDLARRVDGARACPPEDCGGVDGYGRMLEILFDPTHEEFEEMRQWVGPDFQPERFDIRKVNERLATVGWREEAI